ncbi:MAG: phosphotransferase [Actinobacteria bacterium]|nr:phosphotransferase [Actinomycetota bacterium]
MNLPLEEVSEIAPLIARRVQVLHPVADGEGGGDVDLVAEGIDPLWPLRLARGWRVCQSLHHDIGSWYWVLERSGGTLAVDVLDDPRGLGRYGYATAPMGSGDGAAAAPAARAGYLAIKRLRKGRMDPSEWRRIGLIASRDPGSFRETLRRAMGRRAAEPVASATLVGTPPSEALRRRALRSILARRMTGPVRLARVAALEAARLASRVVRPTGLEVLIVGPDGVGKSTVARRLPRATAGLFRRHTHRHFRPGVLPRPGALVGRRAPASTPDPHGRLPHGRIVSLFLLGYHWADFLVGGWLRERPVRARTGLVVVERGWWDLAVDPGRYRLTVSPRLVRALAALLPRPDLLVVLEAPSRLLIERKPELPEGELGRQATAWRRAGPSSVRRIHLDASATAHHVTEAIRSEIVDLLEARTTARLGAGWTSFPSRDSRLSLPRGPVGVARSGLLVQQPVSPRAQLAYRAGQLVARAGGFRLLPRGDAPPRAVREAVAPYVPAGGTLAVRRAERPGRFVALILRPDGRPEAVAKVALTDEGREALAGEGRALETFRPLLAPPLSAPAVVDRSDDVLVLQAVPWRPRLRPWRLPEDVAAAIGRFWRATGPAGQAAPGHGDLAPWNLLWTPSGWALVDWEEAGWEAPPFHDVFHYLVQGCALVGRPSRTAIVDGLRGRGWVGRALRAHAEGAGLPPEGAGEALAAYLRSSRAVVDPAARGVRSALRTRTELLRAVGG